MDGDPVRLAQIFANLLNNAAKYTPDGGQIWLAARQQADQVVVSVRDTGIGIPADLLPRVFEMFMQVDRSSDRAQGGLGIGLTLVRSLVEMHGGTVAAQSSGPGQGSEFTVTLPLVANPQPAGRAGPRELVAGELQTRRVLVVDDNCDAAVTLGLLLKMLGVEVRVVHSGAEALESLDSFRPRVVLLDIGMPGMDGYEVARRIREQPGLGEVTLIALTGWGQEEDRDRSRAAGFDHHLIKPADIRALEALLESM